MMYMKAKIQVIKDKVRIAVDSLSDLSHLHAAVASYMDKGYVSETRVMYDGVEYYEIMVKE